MTTRPLLDGSSRGWVAALPVEGVVRPTSFTSPDAVGQAGTLCPEPWNEEHVYVAVRKDLETVRLIVHNSGRTDEYGKDMYT
jgi:hypothetical protein